MFVKSQIFNTFVSLVSEMRVILFEFQPNIWCQKMNWLGC